MHEIYNVSTIDDCYNKILRFISSVEHMELKASDNYNTASFSVLSAKNSEFIPLAQSNGYVSATLSSIPNKIIFQPNANVDYSIYKNKLADYFVIIALDHDKELIYFSVVESMSYVYFPFTQKYSPYVRQIKNYKKERIIYFAYYTAIAQLFMESSKTDLHCNYNNNCFSFSTIDTTDVTRHTYNVFFGMLRVNRPYSGGIYLAGNACGYLESVDVYASATQNRPGKGIFAYLTYMNTTLSYIQDSTYADIGWHFTNNNPNTFKTADEMYNASAYDQMHYISVRPKKSYYNNFDIFVRLDADAYPVQEMYWASNVAGKVANGKFIYLYSSYGTDNVDIPTYKYIVSNSVLDTGRAINQLNGISMVLPIYLMIKRQPVVLNNYAPIGFMDYVSYVSMYNCSSGSMNELEYPIKDDTGFYECFALYRRRCRDIIYEMPWVTVRPGLQGYNGFAVRQFTKRIKLIDWYILTELRKNHNAWEINNQSTKIKAYQGTLDWDDMPNYKYKVNYKRGYLPLISFFTYYDNIIVEYTDDGGATKKEYEWKSIDLKQAVDSTQAFDIIDGSGDIFILVVADNDYAFPYAQLTIMATGSSCGIIDIIGY